MRLERSGRIVGKVAGNPKGNPKMRKIEENMLHAIRHEKAWRNANTATVRTFPHDDVQGLRVYLHGNQIAFIPDGDSLPIKVTLAGWDTNTTRSRLNAILYPFCGATIGREKCKTWIRFRDGRGGYAPRADEWVTIARK